MDKVKAVKTLVGEALAQSQNPCFTCSFQAEDVAVLHLLLELRPDIPVLFLDTGYHFPEVYAYRDEMQRRLGFCLVNLTPALSREEQERRYGNLYQSDPHRCCQIRKVEPLFQALEAYDTWFTGLRREQSPTRAHLQPLEEALLPSGHRLKKVNPLYDWSLKEVFAYLAVQGLPYLPLYDQGYLSIGCAPCTAKPLDPNDPRSGRWAGKGKLECGIHLHGKEG
ncbi:Phosphoadenylylsulfate reductase [Thermus sp. CCB_US3_UF1]|uniref:phosphoadenylyl-sulfate reductase n=1 Tax=Thermus sp. CCB_US3_UF1 TaxID=1111069 RepID=UPI00023896C5|nr:phosphoadenylyl-sulfate reductase [Thermus sp. CCB_US3_UF1]AEV16393.1 Phosphoadenylylsulfate reductase [Thermus sp. CCB_US3_UF1]